MRRVATDRVIGALAALLAGGACSLETAGDGRYRCDVGRPCPDGRVCSPEGFCELGLSDAAPPDAGIEGACGTLGLLRDDFESISLDRRQWLDLYAGTATVDDGRLVFRPPNTSGQSTVASLVMYLLRDSGASVRVTASAPGTAPEIQPRLMLNSHDSSALLYLADGTLHLEQLTSPGDVVVFEETLPYDPEQHAYWRIRHDTDRLVWETAPDGAAWTERAGTPFDALGRPARLFLWITTVASDTGDQAEVAFDDVNLDAPAVSGFCDIDTLSDDFSGGEIDLFLWDAGECASVQEGRLRFADVDPSCHTASRTAYDLRDSAIAIEVVDPGPGDPTVRMDLVVNATDRLRIEMAAEPKGPRMIALQQVDEGVPEGLDAFALDAVEHRWWGFRHESGDPDRLYIRFSADGEDWDEHPITPSPDVSSVRIEVNTIKEAAGTGVGPVDFDNVNLAP